MRSLAAAEGWLYVDIHVGSIVRSGDRGTTWEPVDAAIHRDVHQVVTCPKAPERVYANTADAVFVSDDRGSTWRHCADGVGARYGRAIAVHDDDPDLLLASLSRGPHEGEGRLYRSVDGGVSWRHLTTGFPPFVEGNIDTACVAFGSGEAADLWNGAVDSALAGRGWLVETLHPIDEPGYCRINEYDFSRHIRYLAQLGESAWVAPIGEVGERIRTWRRTVVQVVKSTDQMHELAMNKNFLT